VFFFRKISPLPRSNTRGRSGWCLGVNAGLEFPSMEEC
jgi:hypothetical protein